MHTNLPESVIGKMLRSASMQMVPCFLAATFMENYRLMPSQLRDGPFLGPSKTIAMANAGWRVVWQLRSGRFGPRRLDALEITEACGRINASLPGSFGAGAHVAISRRVWSTSVTLVAPNGIGMGPSHADVAEIERLALDEIRSVVSDRAEVVRASRFRGKSGGATIGFAAPIFFLLYLVISAALGSRELGEATTSFIDGAWVMLLFGLGLLLLWGLVAAIDGSDEDVDFFGISGALVTAWAAFFLVIRDAPVAGAEIAVAVFAVVAVAALRIVDRRT